MLPDLEPPDLRATIRRDGVVRAVRWYPWLEIVGSSATLLDSRDRAGVTIADLRFIRGEPEHELDLDCSIRRRPGGPVIEVIVEYLCGGGDEARAALVAWAGLVGIGRVWFSHDVVDVEPIPPGKVEVRCSSCRGRLVDSAASFWAFVRRNGHFPTSCPLCGSDLPQWHPVARSGSQSRPGAAELAVVDRSPAA
jgi:hypothetical protein